MMAAAWRSYNAHRKGYHKLQATKKGDDAKNRDEPNFVYL